MIYASFKLKEVYRVFSPGFYNFISKPGPDPNPENPGKTLEPGGFRTGFPGPGHKLSTPFVFIVNVNNQYAFTEQ